MVSVALGGPWRGSCEWSARVVASGVRGAVVGRVRARRRVGGGGSELRGGVNGGRGRPSDRHMEVHVMYAVTTGGVVVALVSTEAEAEAVVRMHRESTTDGAAMRPDRGNATAASRVTYEVRAGVRHPSGRDL